MKQTNSARRSLLSRNKLEYIFFVFSFKVEKLAYLITWTAAASAKAVKIPLEYILTKPFKDRWP